MAKEDDGTEEVLTGQPRTDRERAISMAAFAAGELVTSLRKAHKSDSPRRRALSLRWARAIQRHLAQLLAHDVTGPDTWGALSDEERQFVFADDNPRDAFLARISDVLKRGGTEDAEQLIRELEQRVI